MPAPRALTLAGQTLCVWLISLTAVGCFVLQVWDSASSRLLADFHRSTHIASVVPKKGHPVRVPLSSLAVSVVVCSQQPIVSAEWGCLRTTGLHVQSLGQQLMHELFHRNSCSVRPGAKQLLVLRILPTGTAPRKPQSSTRKEETLSQAPPAGTVNTAGS